MKAALFAASLLLSQLVVPSGQSSIPVIGVLDSHINDDPPQIVVPEKAGRAPLTERDIVEVMTDYDIRHAPGIPKQDWYGMTEFDSRRITMVTDPDLAQRRKITLHELWHAVLRLRGDDGFGDEELIEKLTDSEYKRMFGR